MKVLKIFVDNIKAQINYNLFKKGILSLVFMLLNIGLIFLMYSISETTHSINKLKDDFNNDFAFIYLPTTDMVDYFTEHFNESISIYSMEVIEIDNINFPLYSVITNNDFDIIVLSNRFKRYSQVSDEILLDTVYQNYPVIDSISTLSLHANLITLEPKYQSAFLFSRRSIEQINMENVYLVKIVRNSKTYTKFIDIYGRANDSFDLGDSGTLHVLGNTIYKNTTSIVEGILILYYIIYLIPSFLIIALLRQSYKIFLFQSMVNFKINYIFYKSKNLIVLEEYKSNILLFLTNYVVIMILFAIFNNLYFETLQYLSLTLLIVMVVILYTTNQIVKEAINEQTSYEGDIL